MARRMGGRDCAMLVARSVLWDGSYFANGAARPELPLALVWPRVAVAAGTLVLVLRISGQPMPALWAVWAVWAAFFGMGVLCSTQAYVHFRRILAVAGTTNISLVTFFMPVSAILPGVVVLHEALRPRHLAELALIGMGLACIDGWLLHRMRGVRGAAKG